MAFFGNFFGKEGIRLWVGTVEDRGTGQYSGQKDELCLGRMKVRIHGWHTDNKSTLPTKELPWCYTMNPVTSATISGKGRSPTGIAEGTSVVGFFFDGEGGQIPVVIGTLPKIQAKGGADKTSVGSGEGK
jgi:hypothetical protein